MIILDLEWAEIIGTEVERFLGILLAAQAASQTTNGFDEHCGFSPQTLPDELGRPSDQGIRLRRACQHRVRQGPLAATFPHAAVLTARSRKTMRAPGGPCHAVPSRAEAPQFEGKGLIRQVKGDFHLGDSPLTILSAPSA
jgi:hypothetical protein